MKKTPISIGMLFLSAILFAQSKEAGTEREAVKQFMNNKDPMPALYQNKNMEAIKTVLKQYNNAVEKLDVTGTERLFTVDSKIYESGGSEGNYTHYMEHHLTSELKEFKSFRYND